MTWILLVAALSCGSSTPPLGREVDPTDTAVEERPRETPRLVAGADHTCLLAAGDTSRAAPICWGLHGGAPRGLEDGDPGAAPERVPVLRGASALAGGSGQTCALAGGRVLCIRGRSGTDPEPAVVRITGVAEPATRIASSPTRTCAVGADRGVYCWLATEDAATRVPGVEDATEVAVSGIGACAIAAGGQVRCWGGMLFGQPNETAAEQAEAQAVAGVASARQIAGGGEHACAVLHDGRVTCWGRGTGAAHVRDFVGRHTDPATGPARTIAGITEAAEVAAGLAHACVRRRNGDVLCWGANASGELGDGTVEPRAQPTPIPAFAGAIQIAAGVAHTCALLPNDVVRCAGNGLGGRLGEPPPQDAAVEVAGVEASWIAAGDRWTCTGRTDASAPLACWGPFGDASSFAARIAPRAMSIQSDTPAELQGRCAIAADRTARCWSSLPPSDGASPILEAPFVARVAFASAGDAVCTIAMDGRIRCGRTSGGQPASMREVTQAPRGATDLAIRGSEVLAVDRDRRLWHWEIGARPERVASLGSVAEVEVLGGMACVRFADAPGEADGGSSACAEGMPPNRSDWLLISVRVEGLTAGSQEMCGIAEGAVQCWTISGGRIIEREIRNVSDARQLALGTEHGCALRTTGGVACWGEGAHGQLGAVPPHVRPSPITVTLPAAQ